MNLQRNNQQSLLLKENAPLLIVLVSLFLVGAVTIGVYFLAINNSEEAINEFENEVNGLVESVNQETDATADSEEEDSLEESETEKLASGSNPFQVPLEKADDPGKEEGSSSSKEKESGSEDEKPVKERIGDQVNVLGLLGSSDRRLAIIKVSGEVQIVKPGDKISSLIIKDINSNRILAEEYDEELTYTFGGGQD
ncbi:MAG: hypothetical protein ACQERJ_07865 [Bacillota bacterium]